MAFQKPKGTQDILPGEVEKWQYFEQTARNICRRFNYKEIRTPIFEATELFQRGVGETTDIVEKEMYTFMDKGNRSMTLRPEGTAGVVRAYVENKLYGEPDITKLYYIGPMFRYERPQAGRYRQLHQFGVEVFGAVHPSIDAEVIALGYLFYQELGIKGVTVELNSVGNAASRQAYRDKLVEFLAPMKDDLCRDCQSRYERNPLRILDCKVDQSKFGNVPSILDSLDEESTQHFEQVQQHLKDMGIDFVINPRLVRGLDYYTHTAFEYKAEGIGAIDTIGGGGRFNGLVSQIGGPEQPGIGFGLGIERAILILEHQQVQIPLQDNIDVYFVTMGDPAVQYAVKFIHQLRQAGFTADMDFKGRKFAAQMKSAERNRAKVVAILGESELEHHNITLKNLATEEKVTIPMDEIQTKLHEWIRGGDVK